MAEIIGFKDRVRERPSRGWRAGKHLSENQGARRCGAVVNFVEEDWPIVGKSDGAAARTEGSPDQVRIGLLETEFRLCRRSDWR